MMPEGTDFVNAPDTAPIFYSMYKTISRVVLWNRHLGSILQPIFTLWECIPVSVGASSHDGIGILTVCLLY